MKFFGVRDDVFWYVVYTVPEPLTPNPEVGLPVEMSFTFII